MAKPSKPLVLGFILAVLIACAATLTMYAMQQKPAPPAATGTDACNCRDSGITGGVRILHCTCTPGNLNCLVARSVSTGGGPVATSCK